MTEPTQLPSYQPREIARRYRVGVDKVHHWIKTKQLRAIDVSTNDGGSKPTWMILAEYLKAFEQKRSALPDQLLMKPGGQRRRKRKGDREIIQFV